MKFATARNFWLRLGLPRPASNWNEAALNVDKGTDLLVAKHPQLVAELLSKWLEVVDEHPDLKLLDVPAPEGRRVLRHSRHRSGQSGTGLFTSLLGDRR